MGVGFAVVGTGVGDLIGGYRHMRQHWPPTPMRTWSECGDARSPAPLNSRSLRSAAL
jgi:hypothetical protein